MPTWDRLAELPLEIDSYALEPLEAHPSPDFTRLSTVVRFQGGGTDGVGEDVTYEGLDQIALQDAGAEHDLAGSHTLASFCERIGELDLFPAAPEREVSRAYRRWAFESAGLDLALRQAERSLAEALEREPRPVIFVMSMRLGEPSSVEPVTERLESYPTLRFKLDPVNDWTDELIAQLAATGAIDSLDLKGFYSGTVVAVETDPELYRKVAEAFPGAWLEDPDLTPETDRVLEPHRDRITWDAPIHSIADIEALPFAPRMVNVKPSRFGSLQELCNAYDYCDEQRIGAYGGGQWELGPGRGQIQYLAALFHPGTPNDVAPTAYNMPELPQGLPESPLQPELAATGFRWAE